MMFKRMGMPMLGSWTPAKLKLLVPFSYAVQAVISGLRTHIILTRFYSTATVFCSARFWSELPRLET